ncbi:MAG: PAS domain S-box protein [Coleofasciculaceae cyanobacterium]
MSSLFNKLFTPTSIEYLILDRNLAILETSPGVGRLVEHPNQVKPGKDVRLGFPEIIGAENILTEVLQRQRSNFELKGISRSGQNHSTFYLDLHTLEYQDEKNLDSRLVILLKDVTELMLLKQSLVQRANEAELLLGAFSASQNYLNKIIDSMADALIVIKASGKIKQCNRSALQLLGYSQEELTNRPVSLVIENENFWQCLSQQRLEHQIANLADREVICKTKSGEEITLEFSCSVIQTEVEDLPDFVCIGRDITERKRVAEELRESQERFREAFEYAAIGMALVSPEGCWLQVNHSLCEMVGYSEQELLATTFQAITHPEDLDVDINYVRQMLSGEICTYQMQKRYLHKQGQIVWILLSVSLVRDSQGQPLYFIAQIQDITERKRAEEELEHFFNLSPDLLCVAGTDGYFRRLNPSFETTLGYSKEEILDQPYLNFVHREDQAATLVEMEKLANGIPTIQFENRYRRRDGRYRWLSWTCFPVPQEGLIYAVARDITDRKESGEALEESEERLRIALEATRMGTWDWNILTNQVTWSDNLEHLLGMRSGSFDGRYETFSAMIHLEDRDRVSAAVDNALYHCQDYNIEYRLVLPDSRIRWCADTGQVFYDSTGRPVRLVGVNLDITERKHSEEEVLQKSRALENFSANLKHLHRINTTNYQDADSLFTDCLDTGREIFGLSIGVVSQVIDQSCIIRAARSDLSFVTPGLEVPLENTYCIAVVKERRTITYYCVGENRAMHSHPVYQNFKLESYIGAPIFVQGEIYGVLNFSSTQPRSSDFEPHELEIVELMAQSIGRFIAAHQVEQERQLSAEELQLQHRRSQLFAHVTLKIRRSLQLEEILETTVTEVQRLLKADRVIIFQLRPDGSGVVIREAVLPGWPVLMNQSIDDPCFREEYIEQYRQGKVTTVSDVERDSIQPCHAKFLQQFGIKANLVVPILQRSELWGLLIAHQCQQPRQWTTFETELLQQLANQLGIALAQSQLVEALRESEARFRTMADSAPVLLWISGLDGKCTFFNQGWLNFTGRTLEQEINEGWTEAVHPEDLPYCLNTYRSAFAARLPFQIEYRLQRVDGEYRWVLDTGVPRFSPDGSFAGYIGSCIDISERREVERLKDEFVSVVSHELRTPLTSILGALDLLASGVLRTQPQQAQHMLEIAAKNADRLVRLINDILDIERIESGKVTMTKQVCDTAHLISASVEVMHSLAENAGVTLSVSPLSVRLWADPDRIIQVITNLLSNAIKFSSPGSTVWLTAELQLEETVEREQTGDFPLPAAAEQVKFQVRDRGRGIPADKLETIFGRFQQVDASDSRQKGGTGLGLAICRTIIQHHGGRIWAESNPGVGSTFFFTLPVLQENTAVAIAPEGSPLVLACDDDPSVREVVKAMLEQRGYQAMTVASGQDALQYAIQEQPKVILLNLMMPGMSGWETLAALKEQKETRNIPVIILSGVLPDAREIPHPQVSNWIVKPPDEKQLFQALAQALAQQNQNIKVLVVEDDLDLAQVLIAVFRRYDIETYHAQTGLQAIQLSQQIIPDLLVLDLVLPECDGFAVVDWLRQHNRLCQVPLIVYTSKDLEAEERERLKLGQTLFLTKGRITPEEFEQRVINLLSRVIQDQEGESSNSGT